MLPCCNESNTGLATINELEKSDSGLQRVISDLLIGSYISYSSKDRLRRIVVFERVTFLKLLVYNIPYQCTYCTFKEKD